MASLNDKDRAELVAYLDGELDEQSAKALEAKLSLDPEARQEAVALQKTWDLLDYLPRPDPSPNFTHRTLERISGQMSAFRTGRGKGPWPRWVIAAGWAAALVLAAGLGFGAVTLWTHSGKDRAADPLAQMDPAEVDQKLVRNLRLLENQRLYENVDDLDFLRALDAPEFFGDGEAAN